MAWKPIPLFILLHFPFVSFFVLFPAIPVMYSPDTVFTLFRFNDVYSSHTSNVLPTNVTLIASPPQFSCSSTHYESRDPIFIHGDDDFHERAAIEGWPGDGTEDNPFIIEGYLLSDSPNTLIYISDTSSSFIIRDNFLIGLDANYNALECNNVRNGIIQNNTIVNSSNGIVFYGGEDNSIINNTVYRNSLVGIRLEGSNFNKIHNNSAFQNNEHGFWLFDSSNNLLSSNTGFDNTYCGIKLVDFSDNNALVNNFVYDNGESGIWLSLSSANFLYNNSSQTNSGMGIDITDSSLDNLVTRNFLSNNNQFGIKTGSSHSNQIVENNFLDNAPFFSAQAYDDRAGNTFTNNFWNDHTSPDADVDGIVDTPYLIEGDISSDRYPVTSLIDFKPIIIDGNELFGATALQHSWVGDGTFHNPYIIDNLSFIGVPLNVDLNFLEKMDLNLLDIRNTDVYFQIKDCFFSHGTNGIYLSNVTHGQIINNTVSSSYIGIRLNDSANNNISSNFLVTNYIGIEVGYQSNLCSFQMNILSDNLRAGIFVFHSSASTILNNSFHNDGLFLFGWNLETSIQSHVSGNVINGKPLLFWQNVTNQTVPANTGQIILVNCSGIEIVNQVLSGSVSGFFASYCTDLNIQHNTFSFTNDEGFWLWHVENSLIYNNTIHNTGYSGFGLYYTCNIIASQNTVFSTAEYGVYCFNSTKIHLSHNTLSYTGFVSIDIGRSTNISCQRNAIFHSNDSGLSIWDSVNCTLSDNSISNTEWSSIAVYSSDHCSLIGNTIFDSENEGIFLLTSNQTRVESNSISYASLNGIMIESSPFTLLYNNTILLTEDRGITLIASDHCTLEANHISRTDTPGIWLDSIEFCLLTENTIVSTYSQGILVMNSNHCTFSANLISKNHRDGIVIFDSSNFNFTNNIISRNNGYGIFLGFGAQSITIKFNDFIDNYPDGSCQACDDGQDNHFTHNYWADWSTPDLDDDGIVDFSYDIDGAANNLDRFPLISSFTELDRVSLPWNVLTGFLLLGLITFCLVLLKRKNKL